jgi:hypothetical protein
MGVYVSLLRFFNDQRNRFYKRYAFYLRTVRPTCVLLSRVLAFSHHQIPGYQMQCPLSIANVGKGNSCVQWL